MEGDKKWDIRVGKKKGKENRTVTLVKKH